MNVVSFLHAKAMRLRNAMIVNNVRFDANSFAYLLAVSKKQSQKFIKKLLNSMDAYNVKIDQLFLETNFTKVCMMGREKKR